MSNPKFETFLGKNKQYYFHLRAKNGQIILSSEGYTTKSNCVKGIESVKRNSTDNSKYETKKSKNGKCYFNLKATNGQIIGTSQMYSTEAAQNNGIKSVTENAPIAKIIELG